jgi:hypothetical protein
MSICKIPCARCVVYGTVMKIKRTPSTHPLAIRATEKKPNDPDAVEIIKLHNTVVFFGTQTLFTAVRCGELLYKKKLGTTSGSISVERI